MLTSPTVSQKWHMVGPVTHWDWKSKGWPQINSLSLPRVHAHTYTHAHTHAHIHKHMRAHTPTYMHMCTHPHTDIPTCTHTLTQKLILPFFKRDSHYMQNAHIDKQKTWETEYHNHQCIKCHLFSVWTKLGDADNKRICLHSFNSRFQLTSVPMTLGQGDNVIVIFSLN